MLFKLLYILIIFQLFFLQQLGFGSFYYFLIPIILYKELTHFNFNIKKVDSFMLYFLLLSFILLILNLFIGFNMSKIIMYFSILWIPLLLFVKSNSTGINTNEFIQLHLKVGIVVALVGIIEFHLSRDLFGLIPRVGFDVLYEDFSFFYRTRSFLYSIQINALFLVTVFMLLCEHDFTQNKYLKFLIFTIIIYALVLTGSRTAILLPVMYLIIKHPKKFMFYGFSSLVIFIFIFLSYLNITDNEQFNRLFDFALSSDEFLSQNIGRLETQQSVFKNANLLIGNGIGSTYSNSENYINPESYYVQVFSEFGIIGLIFLVVSFIQNIFSTKRRFKVIIFVMAFSGFIVHGLSSPFLFIFWVLLFSKKENQINNNQITLN